MYHNMTSSRSILFLKDRKLKSAQWLCQMLCAFTHNGPTFPWPVIKSTYMALKERGFAWIQGRKRRKLLGKDGNRRNYPKKEETSSSIAILAWRTIRPDRNPMHVLPAYHNTVNGKISFPVHLHMNRISTWWVRSALEKQIHREFYAEAEVCQRNRSNHG